MQEYKKVSDLKTNEQVRKELGDLTELTSSIKEHGVIVPILVDKDDVVIAGHRRLEAAKAAGVVEILTRVIDTKDKTAIQIVENLQRKDLNAIEEGQAYKTYMQTHKCDAKQLAKRISKTENYVQRRIDVLKIIPEAEKALTKGEIEIGHAVILGQMTKAQQKISLINILSYDLTVQNFSDQIRWMKKIDFGNLKFRPSEDNGQQTLLGNIGKELDPKNDLDINYSDEGFTASDAFKKEIAVYVESQRELIRSKGITVFNSEEELKAKHEKAENVPSYYNAEYNKAVKALPGSKTYAVVIDFENNDIDTAVYRLTPKEEVEKESKTVKGDKGSSEETEKTLELNRAEKLKIRTGQYARKIYETQLEALVPEQGKKAKIMALWALVQPQSIQWELSTQAKIFLKELGCKQKGGGWGEWNNALKKISELSEDVLDSWIKKATTWKYEQLTKGDMKTAMKMVGFNPAKHWVIDQEYLEIHTKDQLAELIKELKLKTEATGKKSEIIENIMKEKLKGKVPKAMK